MRVGLYTARHLGEAIANYLHAVGTTITARHHKATGWWGTAGQPHNDDVFATTPDLVISVLTDHIFTPDELSICPVINLHPAPLPTYRGCNSYSHAIINDDRWYSVTLHLVDEHIDTGNIILTRTIPIHTDDTAKTLHDRAQGAALSMFADWWEVDNGIPPGEQQDEDDARYYPRSSLEPYRNLAHFPPQHRERIRRALTFPPHPMPKEPA
jgi:methionyl-tRNA formyltransferase